MKLQMIDAGSIYRRLLATTSPQEREEIYRQELLAPFEGMIRMYGCRVARRMAQELARSMSLRSRCRSDLSTIESLPHKGSNARRSPD